MWMVLGECISADKNTNNEERKKSIDTMQDLLASFREPDVKAAIKYENLKKYIKYCQNGIQLLKREMEKNTEQEQQ